VTEITLRFANEGGHPSAIAIRVLATRCARHLPKVVRPVRGGVRPQSASPVRSVLLRYGCSMTRIERGARACIEEVENLLRTSPGTSLDGLVQVFGQEVVTEVVGLGCVDLDADQGSHNDPAGVEARAEYPRCTPTRTPDASGTRSAPVPPGVGWRRSVSST